jgi:hypothetical protein
MRLTRRLAPTAILFVLVFLSLAALGAATIPPVVHSEPPLTVHEWGTFTSIAGRDGQAEQWSPLYGPDDLPCFVERYSYDGKGSLGGTVRMETPVLYFYASDEMTVNVNVRFRRGAITEWYPQAAVFPRTVASSAMSRPNFESAATWSNVKVMPGLATPQLLEEAGQLSHYYLARETDAAPVQIGRQQEKFLFYRGVAGFQPPITAVLTGEQSLSLTVTSPTGDSLGDLIVFENRAGKMGYQVQQVAGSEARLALPALTDGEALPTQELEQILIARGLFPKEAKAMVDTWRDSWFEDGVRLFYIAPRSAIDAVLPLTITPEPAEIARAFVGRIEVITPRIEQEARRAIDAGDRERLRKYGRFLASVANRALEPLRKARPVPVVGIPIVQTPELERANAVLTPLYNAQWRARRPCESRPTTELPPQFSEGILAKH